MSRPLPEPADALLERFADDVQEIMLALRERVLRVVPHAHETIRDVGYTVSLQYGPDERVAHGFCYIAGFAKHANLGFHSGAALLDPQGVLEGTGAQMRHIKFAAVAQTTSPWLARYLDLALAQRGLDGHIGDSQSVVARPTPVVRSRRSQRSGYSPTSW